MMESDVGEKNRKELVGSGLGEEKWEEGEMIKSDIGEKKRDKGIF